MQIRKRSGALEDYAPGKITAAMSRAFASVGEPPEAEVLAELVAAVEQSLGQGEAAVEEIQDQVERALMARGHFAAAKSYILYRQKRTELRAARQEIVRRYYTALCDRRVGAAGDELVNKLELLMQQAHVDPSIRPVVAAAAQVAEETGNPAGAIELPSGEVVTGKTTDLMGASSATLLNALKRLAGIDHQHHLISREAIEPIQAVKVNHLGSVNPRLHSDETLIALAISATTNPLAKRALDQLSALRGCEAHSTVILSPVDSGTYSRLGLRLTCEPQYETNKLYHK